MVKILPARCEWSWRETSKTAREWVLWNVISKDRPDSYVNRRVTIALVAVNLERVIGVWRLYKRAHIHERGAQTSVRG